MTKIMIVAGMATTLPKEKFDFLIGVDRGNLTLINQGLKPNIAVGDFDSVSADELARISVSADRVIKLPTHKDDTDLEVALTMAIREIPESEIQIWGSLGGRLDHMMTNFYLPISEQFESFCQQISLINEQNRIYYLKPGRHILKRQPDMKYIGFLQVDTQDTLSIEQAKYPLSASQNFKTIYASNEFIAEQMTVSFDYGHLIVIYSRDKN